MSDDEDRDERTEVPVADVMPQMELTDLRLNDEDLVGGVIAIFKIMPMEGRPYLQVRMSDGVSWFEGIGMLQSTASAELRKLAGA